MSGKSILAGAVAVFGAGFVAEVAATCCCGFVVQTVCPTCTPNNVTSGCVCKKNGESCDCSKASGGIQSEILVTCSPGPFDFTEEESGYTISATTEETMECGVSLKCMTEGGGQIGCGTYSSGTPSCAIPLPPPCGFREFTTSSSTFFVQGEACTAQ